jgi:hypothetical protein
MTLDDSGKLQESGVGDGDYAYEIRYTGKLSDTVTGFIGGRFSEDDANNTDVDILNLHLIYVE